MKLVLALTCVLAWVLAGRLCLAQSPPDSTTAPELEDFWRDLDARFEEPLSPALRADWPGIGPLDSLGAAGDREMQALLAGRRWRTSISPLARTAFNRCEGLRPGLAVTRRHLVRHGATLGAGLGYGIARERFVWDLSADVPLVIAAPTNAEGRPTSRSWPAALPRPARRRPGGGLRGRARHRAEDRDHPRRFGPAHVSRRPRWWRGPGLAPGLDPRGARRLAVRGAVPVAGGHRLDAARQCRRRARELGRGPADHPRRDPRRHRRPAASPAVVRRRTARPRPRRPRVLGAGWHAMEDARRLARRLDHAAGARGGAARHLAPQRPRRALAEQGVARRRAVVAGLSGARTGGRRRRARDTRPSRRVRSSARAPHPVALRIWGYSRSPSRTGAAPRAAMGTRAGAPTSASASAASSARPASAATCASTRPSRCSTARATGRGSSC